MASDALPRRRWGDQKQWGDDDYTADDTDVPSINQSRTETGPDAHGIKTITEFHKNEQDQRVRIVRKVKVVKKQLRINKRVVERRKWKKFGACAGFPPGPEENVTYVSTEKIVLDFSAKQDVKEDKGPVVTATCRFCGGKGHWTLRCPNRTGPPPSGSMPPMEETSGEETSVPASAAASSASASTGKYVAPHGRPGAKPSGAAAGFSRGGDDFTTVRVSNLSLDTTETDLQDLFRPFGSTTRIFLAKDRQTNTSRGFAFITYLTRECAQKAIDKLDGYGYDSLIIHVEWSKPSHREKAD